MADWDLLQANVVEKEGAVGAFIGQFYCTSGAIQNGVPTEVFLLRRVFVSWAETPAGKRIHILAISLILRAMETICNISVTSLTYFFSFNKDQTGKCDDL